MIFERPECDFCGKTIKGMVTNVGSSMEVLLSCEFCLGSD